MHIIPSPLPYLPKGTRIHFTNAQIREGWGMAMLCALANKMDDSGWACLDSPARPSPMAFQCHHLRSMVLLTPYRRTKRTDPDVPTPFLLALYKAGAYFPYFHPFCARGYLEEIISTLYSLDPFFFPEQRPALSLEEADNGYPVSLCLPNHFSSDIRNALNSGLVETLLLATQDILDTPLLSAKISSRKLYTDDLTTLSFPFVTVRAGNPSIQRGKKSGFVLERAEWILSTQLEKAMGAGLGWIHDTADTTRNQVTKLKRTTLAAIATPNQISGHQRIAVEELKHTIASMALPKEISI